MTLRTCIYARYSSDLQSDASIEDQVRICSEKAEAEGWKIENCYTDAGISGSSLMRPGIQSLMQSAMNGEFDILVAEALDRLSRDQEDIAGLFKRMEFAGVKIFTLSEGEISSLHIGLKGTMNAMFLKDLADKTRRGLRGRVEQGKSGGGLAYGYRVKKQFDVNGEILKGDREINDPQAEIIRRIYQEYGFENKSPKAIAAKLNQEGIPCPSGKAWGQSIINGNRKRGTGILNNPLYIGELIWNRQHFIKDPSTGRRVPRFNPESEWIHQDVPNLRIVSDELWNAAKSKQKELNNKTGSLGVYRRPQYLLSGLLKCGVCGGGFSKINKDRYGCSAARNKGDTICTNKKTITRDTLEDAVLNALQSHLMRDDLVQVFCEEYMRHMNSLRSAQSATLKRYKMEQRKLAKEKENIVQAIKDGVPASMIKDDLIRVANRQEELEELLALQKQAPKPLIHPSMASRYRAEVQNLRKALTDHKSGEAKEHVRRLIEKIILTPKANKNDLSIDLYGDLAGILRIATEDKTMKEGRITDRLLNPLIANDNNGKSDQMVAGAGFEPTTFGL